MSKKQPLDEVIIKQDFTLQELVRTYNEKYGSEIATSLVEPIGTKEESKAMKEFLRSLRRKEKLPIQNSFSFHEIKTVKKEECNEYDKLDVLKKKEAFSKVPYFADDLTKPTISPILKLFNENNYNRILCIDDTTDNKEKPFEDNNFFTAFAITTKFVCSTKKKRTITERCCIAIKNLFSKHKAKSLPFAIDSKRAINAKIAEFVVNDSIIKCISFLLTCCVVVIDIKSDKFTCFYYETPHNKQVYKFLEFPNLCFEPLVPENYAFDNSFDTEFNEKLIKLLGF